MKDSESLAKNITRYAASNMFQRACGIVNTFIKPRLLPPELFGLWNLICVLTSNASHAHLGTKTAMFYLLPYHKSRNETDIANAIKSAVFYGFLSLSILIAAGIWVYAFLGNLNRVEQAGLISAGVMIIVNSLFDFQFTEISADKKFKLISAVNYKRSVLALVLNAVLIYYLSIYGIYLATILSVLIMVIYLHMVSPIKLPEPFDKSIFLNLVKKGLPILIYNVSNDLISTIDRVIIAYFLGIKELGYYSITGMVFNFLIQIPSDAREVVEVDLMGNTSTNTREQTLDDYFFKPLTYTSHFMPFLLGPSFFLIAPFIYLALPKYIKGIVPSQILIIGTFFFALSYIPRGVIVAHNKQFIASIIICLLLGFNIVAATSVILMGYGTIGVACGNVVSFFILFMTLYLFVHSFYKNISVWSWLAKIKDVFISFFIMSLTIAALVYICSVIPVNKHIGAVMATAVYCLVMYAASAYTNPGFLHEKILKMLKRRKG
ncbi:MAG: oligosaccharide flippase family protein [Nitrospirae bacterium]|nr:oligosaccharide flippase family protein [Nitrospirota bacterium]